MTRTQPHSPETQVRKRRSDSLELGELTRVAKPLKTFVRIVLPAYNEQESIEKLIRRIVQTMNEAPWEYEIIVVDDGSSDETTTVVRSLERDFPVQLHCHEVNMGLGRAISTCLHLGVEGLQEDDVVISMDSDNTHPPQLMMRMVPMIREGFDIVIASRYQPGARVVGLVWYREWMSFGARVLMSSLFPIRGCRDYTCGYRAYRVGLLKRALHETGGRLTEESGFACMADILLLLSRFGGVIGEVPLLLRYDYKRGQSKMKIWSTIARTLRMLARHRFGAVESRRP